MLGGAESDAESNTAILHGRTTLSYQAGIKASA